MVLAPGRTHVEGVRGGARALGADMPRDLDYAWPLRSPAEIERELRKVENARRRAQRTARSWCRTWSASARSAARRPSVAGRRASIRRSVRPSGCGRRPAGSAGPRRLILYQLRALPFLNQAAAAKSGGRTNSMLSDHVMWVRIGASTPPEARRSNATTVPRTAAAKVSTGLPLGTVVNT